MGNQIIKYRTSIFCRQYREIVWHLPKEGHPYVQLEPRSLLRTGWRDLESRIKRKKVVRLGLNKTDEAIPVDLLYSEEALLP